MGHRCRHNADASLRFRVIEPWQRVLIQLASCLRVSLVRQLARSAWPEISPRRRRCAVVFVGRRRPTNHAPGERRSIFGRRRSLSTKVNRNGKPPRLSSSVSVSPSHAQQGISGVRRQPPKHDAFKQHASADRHCRLHVFRNAPHNALHGDSLRATAKARSPNEDSEERPAGSATSIAWLACPTSTTVGCVRTEDRGGPSRQDSIRLLGCTGAPAVCWWRPRASSPLRKQRSRVAEGRNSAMTESPPSKEAGKNSREKSRERYGGAASKRGCFATSKRGRAIPTSGGKGASE